MYSSMRDAFSPKDSLNLLKDTDLYVQYFPDKTRNFVYISIAQISRRTRNQDHLRRIRPRRGGSLTLDH